ncbi:hypothetical protein [Aquitalea sp. LB_tupeE]|uniref:hypothetical protein n=1 Tax=Aquitalea sp. LB_tupeE TaxID=2748078 RepID=UPI0015BC747F|nr:hypothetical protein [Aquitalea sp. LB_tupeE]NWK76528.1 hypothetical protein [Aquitalea sp. LB_tupeE]
MPAAVRRFSSNQAHFPLITIKKPAPQGRFDKLLLPNLAFPKEGEAPFFNYQGKAEGLG